MPKNLLNHPMFQNMLSQILKHHGQKANFMGDDDEEDRLDEPFTNEERDVQVTPFMKDPYYDGQEPMTFDPEILAELFKVPDGHFSGKSIDQTPQPTFEQWPNQVQFT